MTDQPTGFANAFPSCERAETVPDACTGLVDDLWYAGGLPSVYLLLDGRLRCQAARGYFQVVDGFPPGTGVIGRTVETGLATIIDDVTVVHEFIAAIPGIRAEACAPVLVHGEVVGAVNIESTTSLPKRVEELITAAAEQLGSSIEKAGGLPPVSLAQRLARIAVGLTALTDTGEIEERSVHAAVQLSQMSSAALSACDGAGVWSVRNACGPLAEALCGWSDADHRVIAGWVQAGTSSHFPGRTYAAPRGYAFLLRAGVRALSVHPLVVGGSVTGLLTTADTRFVEHDSTVGAALELLAAQTASSLATAAAIEELSHRALQDQLTGLKNGAAFIADLRRAAERAAASTPGEDIACFLIDVDSFKDVNDTYGHPAGDGLLRDLAQELAVELRDTDGLYRVGGDEFAVLAPLHGDDTVALVADRLLTAGRRVRTTISLGVTLLGSAEPETVRLTADRALYRAKSAGRDQAIFARVGEVGTVVPGPWPAAGEQQ